MLFIYSKEEAQGMCGYKCKKCMSNILAILLSRMGRHPFWTFQLGQKQSGFRQMGNVNYVLYSATSI